MDEEGYGLDSYMLQLADCVGGLAGSNIWQILENGNHRTRDTRETKRSSIEEQNTLGEEGGPVTSMFISWEVEVGLRVRTEASAYRIEGKSLVVLQFNCRGVCYKRENGADFKQL
jgi:hypothetical protein